MLSSIASLGVIISLTLNQTAHAQLGWDVDTDLSKQKIFITATTHEHIDETNVCTLWIKQGDKILLIGLMPETGKKTFDINKNILIMLKDAEMIISFEDKNTSLPSKPSVVDYQGKWVM